MEEGNIIGTETLVPIKELFEDWNEVSDEDKKARQEAAEREDEERREIVRIEQSRIATEAAKASVIGQSIIRIKDQVVALLKGRSVHVKENTEDKHYPIHGFGYTIMCPVEKGKVEVSVAKKYPASRYGSSYDKAPTGIEIIVNFQDGGGYGKEHESKGVYSATIDGEWRFNGFANRVKEKIERYESRAKYEREAADTRSKEQRSKDELVEVLTEFLEAKVVGHSERKTDYGKKYGSPRNRSYATYDDTTARRFSTEIPIRWEGTDRSLKMFFELSDERDTVRQINITGTITPDQLKKIHELLKSF